MAIAKQTGVAVANIGKRSGRQWTNIASSLGLARAAQGGGGGGAGSATTYLSEDWGTGSYTLQTLPSGWTVGTDSYVVFGKPGTYSQTYNVAPSSSTSVSSYGWKFDYNATGSGGTGPNGGLSGGVDATSGTQSSTNRYIYYEASGGGAGQGYNATTGQAHAFVTPELDFSDALSNNTLKLTFWFHIYSSGSGNSVSHDFAVAATTSATDASEISEVVTGSGLQNVTSGGLNITRWTDDTGTTTATSNRISGTQQTSNTGLWRKAEVDLNDLAGESSVYIHFVLSDVRYFRADFAVDGIKIVGEE
jgi:hypothetical protein